MATFMVDGWIASGLALAWPMVLFSSVGGSYGAFGLANAAAGLVGAAVSFVCGRAIDGGRRQQYLVAVCVMLAFGFALRIASAWSPVAAAIANLTGAIAAGFYGPVVMSTLYERAKQSGAAYRFHFALEGGWDFGAVTGCLAAAILAWATMEPALALLPASMGVIAIYLCVRGGTRTRSAPRRLPPFRQICRRDLWRLQPEAVTRQHDGQASHHRQRKFYITFVMQYTGQSPHAAAQDEPEAQFLLQKTHPNNCY
ncbi:hypothetical protein ACFQU7_27435 [Pseudoroseomonas wenyumeiae]